MTARYLFAFCLLTTLACEADKPPISAAAAETKPPVRLPPATTPRPAPDTASVYRLAEQIRTVRARVRQLNGVGHWDQVEKRELDNSTDGGKATYYYLGSRLAKIVAHDYGETGQWLTEYYLQPDGKPLFVFEKTYHYNRPYHYDSAQAARTGEDEVFDFAKSRIAETRSYFHQGQLVQQLSGPKQAWTTAPSRLRAEQKRLRTDFMDLLQTLNHPD